MPTFTGGCHCGAVRFQIQLPDDVEVLDCNCSICTKKGILHVIVPDADFTWLAGENVISTYTFGTHTAKHMFCPRCGIHPCYRPRSHPDAWDINVRCLDDAPLDRWRIRVFDGRRWEDNVHEIRQEPSRS